MARRLADLTCDETGQGRLRAWRIILSIGSTAGNKECLGVTRQKPDIQIQQAIVVGVVWGEEGGEVGDTRLKGCLLRSRHAPASSFHRTSTLFGNSSALGRSRAWASHRAKAQATDRDLLRQRKDAVDHRLFDEIVGNSKQLTRQPSLGEPACRPEDGIAVMN